MQAQSDKDFNNGAYTANSDPNGDNALMRLKSASVYRCISLSINYSRFGLEQTLNMGRNHFHFFFIQIEGIKFGIQSFLTASNFPLPVNLELFILNGKDLPISTVLLNKKFVKLLNKMPILKELHLSGNRNLENRFDVSDEVMSKSLGSLLVERHGHVEQLCKVDMTPKKYAVIVVIYEETG
ncbi:Homoserine O-acetyltransferase [Dirofilaria immitis]